jgi:hypothetical protein
MIPIEKQLTILKDWLNLDLETAYITGSVLTYIIESRYRTPSWQPNDIDICCYNFSDEQYTQFTELLKSKSTSWKTHATKEGLENINYRIPNFVTLSTQTTGMNYQTRIAWADFSVCSVCGDGNRLEMEENTIYDIQHKILRRTGPFRNTPNCEQSILYKRYNNYIDKGYIDQYNTVKLNIEEFLKKDK